MTAYLTNRLAQIALVMVLFLAVVFFLIQAQPGDFTSFYALDPNITPEAREAIRRSFGLDKPLYEQFVRYAGNFLKGDLGLSFSDHRPVISVIMERLPRTVVLFMTAAVTSFYLGFFLGKVIAWRRGSVIEYSTTVGGVFLYTVFTPWFALMMIWLFAFRLDWLPIGKFITPDVWIGAPFSASQVFGRMIAAAIAISLVLLAVNLVLKKLEVRRTALPMTAVSIVSIVGAATWLGVSGSGDYALDIARHMVLPVVVLTLISFAGTMLLTRNSMLEVLKEDYVLAARAKGLPESAVRDRHVARNAMLPVVTSFVFSIAFAIDGGVITETVFSWPGLGLTLLHASVDSDLPLAVGAFLFTGVFVLIGHLVADLLYFVLDPRIRSS